MRHLTLLACLLSQLCTVSGASAQTNWAERLGYPADKPVVILHANDMGILYECNRPVQQALTDGPLTSASVVTAGPWFAECADWAKDHRDLDLGISLSFVSPSPMLKWSAVASRDTVPSLWTVDGYLPATVTELYVRADADQIKREAEAQIQRARSMGIHPTHIHPHLGAMLARPDLFRIYLELAQQYWIPAVMVEVTPELVAQFQDAGYPLEDEMLDAISSYPLPKLDAIRRLPEANSYEEKREQFFTLLDELKPGLTQIFLNPADGTPGLRRASENWRNRPWEAKLLTDAEVREYLKKKDIVWTNWREIMERFQAVHDVKNIK